MNHQKLIPHSGSCRPVNDLPASISANEYPSLCRFLHSHRRFERLHARRGRYQFRRLERHERLDNQWNDGARNQHQRHAQFLRFSDHTFRGQTYRASFDVNALSTTTADTGTWVGLGFFSMSDSSGSIWSGEFVAWLLAKVNGDAQSLRRPRTIGVRWAPPVLEGRDISR